jgi:hypothetical protein
VVPVLPVPIFPAFPSFTIFPFFSFTFCPSVTDLEMKIRENKGKNKFKEYLK